MTIIELLKQLDPSEQVIIFLYENKYLHLIADTTVEVLLQSEKEGFKSLKAIATGKDNEGKKVITVIKPEEADN